MRRQMAPKRNTAASVCMDRLHIVMMRWSWTDDDFCGKQWKFAKYVAIPAPSKNTNTSINLLLHNFLHDYWVALWCQKFDSVMSGQSDANLRIIGIQCVNTESCSASHKWIALHCCVGQSDDWGFGPGQWCPWGDDGHLLTHSRSLDYNTWRRTHKPTTQYIDLYSHTQCTQATQATYTVYKQYTSLGWRADGRSNTRRPADIRPLR